MNTKIKLTVKFKKTNGTVYSKNVESKIDLNKLRGKGDKKGTNNLKVDNLLFGSQFIGEDIITYTEYKLS